MHEEDRDGARDDEDDVEAVDFGPYFNDWVRQSSLRVARLEMRLDESALVVMGEGDDNTRNS